MFNSKIFAAIAFTTAAIAPVASAHAATMDDSVVTQQISYADLDLTTAQGQDALNNRLEIQVRRVCRVNERGTLAREEEQACIVTAMNKVRPIADRAIANAIASPVQ